MSDDDTAAIVVEAAENFAVTEGGTATYSVKLATKPGSDVVIQLSVPAGSGLTVDTDSVMAGDQSKLTFTTHGLVNGSGPSLSRRPMMTMVMRVGDGYSCGGGCRVG